MDTFLLTLRTCFDVFSFNAVRILNWIDIHHPFLKWLDALKSPDKQRKCWRNCDQMLSMVNSWRHGINTTVQTQIITTSANTNRHCPLLTAGQIRGSLLQLPEGQTVCRRSFCHQYTLQVVYSELIKTYNLKQMNDALCVRMQKVVAYLWRTVTTWQEIRSDKSSSFTNHGEDRENINCALTS